MKPLVGKWYMGLDCDEHKVVAVDEDDELVEVQYEDGAIEEMDIEAWNDIEDLRMIASPMRGHSFDEDHDEEEIF